MYATVRRYRVNGPIDQVIEMTEQGLVPILKQNPGFIAYYVMDCGDGHGASVSIFETEDAALRSNEQAAAWVKENVAQHLSEAPETFGGKALIAITG